MAAAVGRGGLERGRSSGGHGARTSQGFDCERVRDWRDSQGGTVTRGEWRRPGAGDGGGEGEAQAVVGGVLGRGVGGALRLGGGGEGPAGAAVGPGEGEAVAEGIFGRDG